MDLFRYRCYLASLQGGELPNPKRLLAFASRPTKVAMGRLGIFSVSSFHALVSGHGAGHSRTACSQRAEAEEAWGKKSQLCPVGVILNFHRELIVLLQEPGHLKCPGTWA